MKSKTTLTHSLFPGWKFTVTSPDTEYKEWIDGFNHMWHFFVECLLFKEEI